MKTLEQFVESIAAGTPAPGGGAAAAVTGALAAALVAMVARLTMGRPKYAAAEPEMYALAGEADRIRARLLALAAEDAAAYAAVLEAARGTAGGEADRAARQEQAWRHAAEVPLEVLQLSGEVCQLARRVATTGNPNALGDAAMATSLALAVAEGSHLNLRLNLRSLAGREQAEQMRREADALLDTAREETGQLGLLLEKAVPGS